MVLIFPALSTSEFSGSCATSRSRQKTVTCMLRREHFRKGASSPYERNQEATLRRLAMAKIIPFYIPEPKVLKFRVEEIKKSA
jgi:hypothetical protein